MRTAAEILRDARTIAVVGASPRPSRPSHGVMRYLLSQGYRCIPVRPRDCDEVLGVPCVQTLAEVDEPIDLVDVFRRPEFCPDVARDAGLLAPEVRHPQLAAPRVGAEAGATGGGARRNPRPLALAAVIRRLRGN